MPQLFLSIANLLDNLPECHDHKCAKNPDYISRQKIQVQPLACTNTSIRICLSPLRRRRISKNINTHDKLHKLNFLTLLISIIIQNQDVNMAITITNAINITAPKMIAMIRKNFDFIPNFNTANLETGIIGRNTVMIR